MPNGAVGSWSVIRSDMLMKNLAFLLLQFVLYLVVGTKDSLDGGQDISLQIIILMVACGSHMVSGSK